MKKPRRVGRDATTGRIIRIAEAKARKATSTVETMTPRRRDGEVLRVIEALRAAVGRLEAVVASLDRRAANGEAILKDIAASTGARDNHRKARRYGPDWMSA